MKLEVNTGNTIHGREDVVRLATSSVEGAVGRHRDRITRVEAYLSDADSKKLGGMISGVCSK